MRTLTRSIAFATVLAFGAACSDDSNSPNAQHVGSYPLVSVSGDPVPSVLFTSGTYTLEVVSGTLTLNSNNTYNESLVYRETDNGTSTTSPPVNCPGTYTINGNTITLNATETVDCDAGPYTATFSGGNTVTVDYGEGFIALYRR